APRTGAEPVARCSGRTPAGFPGAFVTAPFDEVSAMTAYLDPLRQFLSQRYPQPNALWNYSDDNVLPADWLFATPINVWGKTYSAFAQSVPGDNPNFPLKDCTGASGPTQLCEVVGATVTSPGQQPRKVLVGHSWQMFEALYDVMVSANVLLDF